MGRFLLQKNILLMRWILLDLLRHIFPVKFPRITPSKHHTTPRRHTSAGCSIMGHHGAGHRPLFYPCAYLRIRRHRRQFVVANA